MRERSFETGSLLLAIFLTMVLSPQPALSQDAFVYPQKGQTKQQQDKDHFECYSWAVSQTGFDPMKRPTASTAPPTQQSQGPGVVGGAARGAAVGAIGGAIGGNAGKGAAIGAGVGGVMGGMRRRRRTQENEVSQEQWAQSQANQYNAGRNKYNRAYGACMRGRGYTVG